jgi:hypothetical protein
LVVGDPGKAGNISPAGSTGTIFDVHYLWRFFDNVYQFLRESA